MHKGCHKGCLVFWSQPIEVLLSFVSVTGYITQYGQYVPTELAMHFDVSPNRMGYDIAHLHISQEKNQYVLTDTFRIG